MQRSNAGDLSGFDETDSDSSEYNRKPSGIPWVPALNNDVGTVGYVPEKADLLGRRISLKVEHAW